MKKSDIEFKAKVTWLKLKYSKIGVGLKSLKEEILDATIPEMVFLGITKLLFVSSIVFYQSHKKEVYPPAIDFYVPKNLPANIDPRIINEWSKGDINIYSEDKVIVKEVISLKEGELVRERRPGNQYWETRLNLLPEKKFLEITYMLNGKEYASTFVIDGVCYEGRDGYGGMLEMTSESWSFNEEVCGITAESNIDVQGKKGGELGRDKSMGLDYQPGIGERYRR